MWVGGVLIGEYVIKAAPVGTHHYEKMISPLDVQRILDTSKLGMRNIHNMINNNNYISFLTVGCHTVLVNGSTYDFWNNTWRWINSTSMCYALQAIKADI